VEYKSAVAGNVKQLLCESWCIFS